MSNLSPKQFKDYSLQYGRGLTGSVTATHAPTGEKVGHLLWDMSESGGRIVDVEVNLQHRRKGLATAMLEHAKTSATATGDDEPIHSKYRTKEGNAWAKNADPENWTRPSKIIKPNDRWNRGEHK
jgi:GNAT superfamily N-acetyltransferase